MMGGMQRGELLVTNLINHAAREHANREIITYWPGGEIERSNWSEIAQKSRQFAQYLMHIGIKKGDRVATLAMNHSRHLVSWYGAVGAGAILHTVNPRLFTEQLVYIINHAQDRVLLFDRTFTPIVESIKDKLTSIEHFIQFDEGEGNYPIFSTLIADFDADFAWVKMDENDPVGLCYTSGTTGNPKGVLYENRSNVIHAITSAQPDVLNISTRSVIQPVVPMFHANAWGLPFSAAAVGSKLVFSTSNEAAILWRLIHEEEVTHSAGVPTVWLSMFADLDKQVTEGVVTEKAGFGPLEFIIIGGSAAPRAMIERFMRNDIRVGHAWGMTETSPIGTTGALPVNWAKLSFDEQVDIITKQGRPPFGVELRTVDDEGDILPRDGKTSGSLQIRGPWIIGRYFQADNDATIEEDWFDTGDVALLYPDGTMQITDRAKDVIKSGGEWISSIALENAALGCDGVAEAAAVGVYHPKWGERPLLLVVRKEGSGVDAASIRVHLATEVAKWWLPDAIKFVDNLPHTATGKLLKRALREEYKDYRFTDMVTK